MMAMRWATTLCGVSVMALVVTTPSGALAQQATTPGTPSSSQPPAESAPSPTEDGQDAGAEVVVTGIRASIASAIETKRQAINVVDSISAQDIGKLPDQNVVDTLSRIPGVQITRSRGDGAGFTIRGISLNNTLVNGRPFVGPSSGSSDRLDVLASDIVGAVDVIKSPSADMIEGALGGTVNLRTKLPLELRDLTVSVRGQGQLSDMVDKLGFRGSALVSAKAPDGRFGALIVAAYQKIYSEQQSFSTEGYTRVDTIDGTGDGVADKGLFRPSRLQIGVLPRSVERLTLNSVLQFKPSDELELVADMTYNKLDAKSQPQRFQVLLANAATGATADTNGTIVAGRFTGVTVRPLVYQEDEHSTLYTLGGKATWRRDGWKAVLDVYHARGVAPIDAGTFTYVVQPRTGFTNFVTYDLRGSDVPNFTVGGSFDTNTPSNYRLASISDNGSSNRNAATAGRIDVSRDLDLGILKRLTVGYRYEDRSFFTARRVFSGALTSLVAVADRDRNGVVTPDELAGLNYGVIGGAMPGLSGDFPRAFLGGTVDAEAGRAQFGYSRPPISPTTVSDVAMKSHAAYAQLDLDGTVMGMPLRGQVGGRFTHVDRVSSGNIDVAGAIRPISYAKKYDKFLPSATLNLEPTRDVVVRLAAARVVASPPLADIAAGFTYNITSNTGSGGNPLLNPYEADQIDATVEWYRGRGNLFAASFFYKKVRSFTELYVTEETIAGFVNPNGTGNVFRITRPRNGSDGEVKGFEVNVQQALDFLPAPLDGFGIQANYTFADSKTPAIDELTGERQPFPSLSRNSYSLIGYYEKGPLQGRLAYTRRSSRLVSTQTAAQGGNRYNAPEDQLDASLAIEVLRGVKLQFDAQNLLRNPGIVYDGVRSRVRAVSIDDRRFFLGFSAAF